MRRVFTTRQMRTTQQKSQACSLCSAFLLHLLAHASTRSQSLIDATLRRHHRDRASRRRAKIASHSSVWAIRTRIQLRQRPRQLPHPRFQRTKLRCRHQQCRRLINTIIVVAVHLGYGRLNNFSGILTRQLRFRQVTERIIRNIPPYRLPVLPCTVCFIANTRHRLPALHPIRPVLLGNITVYKYTIAFIN